MVASSLITHSNIPCRAKDPETCKFHSAERRMNNAVENNDLDGYFRFRAQWEAAKVEDEVQEFLAAHEPVREIERYQVNRRDITEVIEFHALEFDLDFKSPAGNWVSAEFQYVDDVRTLDYEKQLIVRRKSDGKLFGVKYDGDGGYSGEGFYEPFHRHDPKLVEVQAEDTVRIVTVYNPASQPTVEELEA